MVPMQFKLRLCGLGTRRRSRNLSVTPETLFDALRDVYDHRSLAFGRPISLIEMGVVEAVDFQDGVATVSLHAQDSAYFTEETNDIKNILTAIAGVDQVVVESSNDASHRLVWLHEPTASHKRRYGRHSEKLSGGSVEHASDATINDRRDNVNG